VSRTLIAPSASSRTSKPGAVVTIGVRRRRVGRDNGLTRAVFKKGEVSANFALTGISDVLKAKLYSIGVSCSGVFTL
jgi:hypothetical protein